MSRLQATANGRELELIVIGISLRILVPTVAIASRLACFLASTISVYQALSEYPKLALTCNIPRYLLLPSLLLVLSTSASAINFRIYCQLLVISTGSEWEWGEQAMNTTSSQN
jgi:hypothetical protein